jgi:pimeloyl-ACP methyl ester carboxylesterase
MTLVLLGGLGTTRAMWEQQLAAFPEAVALDLPVRSSVEAIAGDVLDAVPGRFAFCGVSLGGMVGMWLGAFAPERVERLVLACTGPKLGERDEYYARAARVRREGTGVVVDGARERWFTPAFRDDPRALRILDDLRGIAPEAYATCAEAVGDFDFRDDVQRIAVPTLVLYGRDDPVTTDKVLPGIEIPGAHLANVESPDEFNDQLRSFL